MNDELPDQQDEQYFQSIPMYTKYFGTILLYKCPKWPEGRCFFASGTTGVFHSVIGYTALISEADLPAHEEKINNLNAIFLKVAGEDGFLEKITRNSPESGLPPFDIEAIDGDPNRSCIMETVPMEFGIIVKNEGALEVPVESVYRKFLL